ncbi:HAMP domain-containing sensor histidine kinase [Nocardioides conyzicola]|uniref:histidine kinase n=1 Tax=Nocardioides conyzicola TaxID=1651781 RepID=A0ABP8XW71_9ACTN
MSRLPLRVRLVAGFVLAMLVLLIAAGAFVYWRVEYALDRGLDTELDQAAATIAPLVGASGRVGSPEAAAATGAGWQVLDRTGRVVDSGGPAPAGPLVDPGDLARVGSGTLTEDIGTLLPVTPDPYRVQVTAVEPGSAYLVVAVRRGHRDEALRELLLQLTLAGLGALAIAAVVGDVLARAALRPVERYRRRAADIAGGAAGLRLDVPPGRDDEITRLGHTLNDMLAALERSLEHERRFVDDASHELRTPLTLLKSRIQLARRRTRTIDEHERTLDELAVDVSRLADLAEQLLELGSVTSTTGTTTDVNVVVGAVVERRRLALPERADDIEVTLAPARVSAALDPIAVERVVDNLVQNALLHGRAPVRVTVAVVDDWVRLTVRDDGEGMTPDLLETATARFTRSPGARSRPGAGLGLSLVDQVVTEAGGELRLCFAGTHASHGTTAPVPCEHGDGMTVSVLLPTSHR